MIGKQSGQIPIVILDIEFMIPEDHLLIRIKNSVNFDFIYEKVAPYYSYVGRKSIAPRCSDKNVADLLSLWDQIREET